MYKVLWDKGRWCGCVKEREKERQNRKNEREGMGARRESRRAHAIIGLTDER